MHACCPTGQGPTGGVDWAVSATTFVCAAALFGWWYLNSIHAPIGWSAIAAGPQRSLNPFAPL
eukprot:2055606-Prymnesium_polylepis.1